MVDIYALAPERSAAAVGRFLAHFVPQRERADADYWVRLNGISEVKVCATPEELAWYCEMHPEAESRAYWTSRTAGGPHSAHVFFLPAGGLVLGLSVTTPNETSWDQWRDRLMSFAGATYGYWIGECPPEDTVTAFVSLAQRARTGPW